MRDGVAAPVLDVLGCVVMPRTWWHDTLEWRGVRYRVLRGGRLEPW